MYKTETLFLSINPAILNFVANRLTDNSSRMNRVQYSLLKNCTLFTHLNTGVFPRKNPGIQ